MNLPSFLLSVNSFKRSRVAGVNDNDPSPLSICGGSGALELEVDWSDKESFNSEGFEPWWFITGWLKNGLFVLWWFVTWVVRLRGSIRCGRCMGGPMEGCLRSKK